MYVWGFKDWPVLITNDTVSIQTKSPKDLYPAKATAQTAWQGPPAADPALWQQKEGKKGCSISQMLGLFYVSPTRRQTIAKGHKTHPKMSSTTSQEECRRHSLDLAAYIPNSMLHTSDPAQTTWTHILLYKYEVVKASGSMCLEICTKKN